ISDTVATCGETPGRPRSATPRTAATCPPAPSGPAVRGPPRRAVLDPKGRNRSPGGLTSCYVTSISLDSEALASIDADAIVIGAAPAEGGAAPAAGAEDLDRALDGRLAEALRA